MTKNKFFALLMIIFMLFSVSGCGGGGSSVGRFADTPISQDNPVPESNDIPITPEPSPQSQDKPVEPVPTPTPTPKPIISHDPSPELTRYTVSFNSNGGSDVSSITVLSGNTINKPWDPKKHGSTFKGWYKDSALTQNFTFGTNGDKVTGNITLYAKWIEDRVLAEIAVERVSIGYQDGDSTNHVTKNITLPRNIDVSGDVANIIWSSNNENVIYTNGTVTRQSSDVTVVLTALSSIGTASKSRAFTLKVIHTETPAVSSYTVSFNSNGGSAVSSITVSSGNTVTQPANPSRSGYTFGGWFKDSALTQAFTFGANGDKVTSNITLYAKWIETDSLRVEVAINKVSIGYQSGDSASSVTKNLTLPTSVNASGDINISWSSNNPSVISNSGTVTRPSGSDIIVVLTAKATAGSISRIKTFTVTVLHEATPAHSGYTVSFDSNGGSTVSNIHVSFGGTVNMPENPTKAGYVFAGWFKDEVFTEIFTFGTDGDKITKNTTLYAQWINADTLRAEYALGAIVIEYADGDNPKYVTQNLSLSTKAGEASITWASSNASVISSNGTVTRPTGSDTEVKLTATARIGAEAKTKEFSVKVIRARSRVSHDVEVINIQKAGSGDLSITYKDSGDQIVDIEGNYSKLTINNADDALDAIHAIHEALGINNTYEELQTFLVTTDSYGSKYSFQQVHKGVKVFGRGVMASTNASCEGNFLHSSFLASSVLDSADMKINLSASEAESKAKASYLGNVSADVKQTEQVVYSLEDYENAPVYAYIVRVYGTSGSDYVDDSVFVNADTGETVLKCSNMYDTHHNILTSKKVSADNELGEEVAFPITLANGYWQMVDDTETPRIEIYSGNYTPDKPNVSSVPTTLIRHKPGTEMSNWDKQAVSVYTNVRKILQWWQASFDRNSLDNKGMTIIVITHQNVFKGKYEDGTTYIKKDNAGWHNSEHRIYVYDRSDNGIFNYSNGADIDTLTHESTHAVIQYTTGNVLHGKAVGAINEGYADIFACIRDGNWKYGERLFTSENIYGYDCVRNITNPSYEHAIEIAFNDFNLPSEVIYDAYKNYEPDNNYVHRRSFKTSHAAYLMHQDNNPTNGLTWNELAQVWYKSMHMGLSASSNFEDVRRCVLWSAQEIGLPPNKIAAIKSAFNEVGITDSSVRAKLSGTVTDYSAGSNLSGVDVVVFDGRISDGAAVGQLVGRKATQSNGSYSFEYEAGTYPIMMMKEGYVVFQGLATISKDQDTRFDVGLVRPGNGSVRGTIRQTSDSSPIQGVTVNIRSGWNVIDATILQSTTTDAEGHYSFTSINNGYYTVELVKRGYETVRFNATVNYNTTGQDGGISGGGEPDIPTETKDIPIDEAHFPDEVFRSYIKTYCDINKDNILSIMEITNTVSIDLAQFDEDEESFLPLYQGVSSLKGIEYFTSLKFLYCQNIGTIEELDVSKNSALEWIWCFNNKLNTLDVSKNTSLKYLFCGGNPLKTLDISKNIELISLDCFSNQLTKLDVSNNTALRYLYCNDNQLKTLDVSNNLALERLNYSNNPIYLIDLSHNKKLKVLSCERTYSMLDISNNTALEALNCSHNVLSNLDLSHNTALQVLWCNNNYFTTLDLSHNTALRYLDCSNNNIQHLDLTHNSALQQLRCWNNELTTLDLSNCPRLITGEGLGSRFPYPDTIITENQVMYDEDEVIITWPSSVSSMTSKTPYSSSTSIRDANNEIPIFTVLAVLPNFTPTATDTYAFTVSLDHTPPEGSTLILLTNSEDIHGSFASTESPNIVRVSADFTAGRTYSPVIVAKTKEQELSGGCNSSVLGIVLLMAVLLRKRRC